LNASETAALGALRNAGGAAAGVTQDFNQIVCGNQTASGNGSNTATVNQHGGAAAAFSNADLVDIDQNRDSIASACTDAGGPTGPGAGPFADYTLSCAVEGGSGSPKLEANTCSRIEQVAASGRNRITRQDQKNLLFASVDGAADVFIDQGTSLGGIDSTQNQQSSPSKTSSIVDVQAVDQIVSVKNATGFVLVTQDEDPRCCSVQQGSTSDTWSIDQRLNQKVFVDGELADPNVFVQDGAVYGHCETTGTCKVRQKASNNADEKSNSCTVSGSLYERGSCDIFITCTAGSGGGSAFRPAAATRPAGRARVVDNGGECIPGPVPD
ncbi:MAG TPA: hypothetical protein VIQ02_00370, partial [Jiangellaceae bacterium]